MNLIEKSVQKLRSYTAGGVKSIIQESVHSLIQDYPLELGVSTAVFNGKKGGYFEFGVYKGRSFIQCYHRFRELMIPSDFSQMRFHAFDSFQGLPVTHDPNAPQQYPEGAFAASRDEFRTRLAQANVNLHQVNIVPGWFDQSLRDSRVKDSFRNETVAVAYIDCDIYESSVPIFEFLTPLLDQGSILVIDDWQRHHGSRHHGIKRAFYEWLEKNPQFQVDPMFACKRITFIVDRVDRDQNARAA